MKIIHKSNLKKSIKILYILMHALVVVLLTDCSSIGKNEQAMLSNNPYMSNNPYKRRKLNNNNSYYLNKNNNLSNNNYYYSSNYARNNNTKIKQKNKRKLSEINNNHKKPYNHNNNHKKFKLDTSPKEDIYHHKFTMINTSSAPYMDYIRSGAKHAEGRINSTGYKYLRPGNIIYFHNHQEGILCKIKFIRKYSTFERMLQKERVTKMLPQLKNRKNQDNDYLLQEGVRIYERFPRSYRVQKFGCIAIGLQYLKDKKPLQNYRRNRYYRR